MCNTCITCNAYHFGNTSHYCFAPYVAATNFTAYYFNDLYTIYTQLYTGLYLFILIIHTGF